jgi:hypothetical protein
MGRAPPRVAAPAARARTAGGRRLWIPVRRSGGQGHSPVLRGVGATHYRGCGGHARLRLGRTAVGVCVCGGGGAGGVRGCDFPLGSRGV